MSEITKALIAARKDIHNPTFDSENPHFRNKFASLKSVIAAVVPVYAEHGIAIVQDTQTIDGGVACFTHFYHESGESLTFGPLVMNATKSDPQGFASASTYARRYHLMSVACVVGDNDDDGNAASEPAFKTKQAKTKSWNALKDAAAEDDALKARETWDELSPDQQKDLWRELSSGIRATIKKLLAETNEDNSND